GRVDAGLRKLKPLLSQHPVHADLHRCAIEFLLTLERHRDAAALLSVAIDRIDDPAFVREGLRNLANLYRQQLGVPERAIATWEKFLGEQPDDAEALSNLCELYLEAEHYEQLLPLLDTRLDVLNPDDREARLPLLILKARTLAGTDDPDGAIALLEPWVGPTLDRDDVLLTVVDLQCKHDRTARALSLLQTRLRLLADRSDSDPTRQQTIALRLADIYQRQNGDPQAALDLVEQTIADTGDAAALLERRAKLAAITGNTELQVASFIAIDTPEALLQAAALSKGEPERARELLGTVLGRLPERPTDVGERDLLVRATANLFAITLATGAVDESEAFLDQQLGNIDETSLQVQLLTEAGHKLHLAGEADRAIARLNQALGFDPDHAPAHLRLGELHLEGENFETAESELEAAMEVFGLNRDTEQLIECMVYLARVLEQTDRKTDAHRHLAAALRQDPQNLSIQAAVARNRAGAGRWRDALATITTACENNPTPADLSSTKAHLLADLLVLAATCEHKLKHEDDVVTRYQQALRYNPHNAEALRALIELCREHELLEEAARHSVALAEGAQKPEESGRAWIEAGLHYL
ncbi:MAG: tetratricopeptide repeat protein, partial [Nannocystaceae bacterium]